MHLADLVSVVNNPFCNAKFAVAQTINLILFIWSEYLQFPGTNSHLGEEIEIKIPLTVATTVCLLCPFATEVETSLRLGGNRSWSQGLRPVN
jgi:hypothetical protein